MRCLGRLVLLVVALILLTAAWLYRGELSHWVADRLHPGEVALRTGTPSAAGYQSAMLRLDSLGRLRPDSVVLSADQLASLLAHGTNLLPDSAADSVTVELGNRSVRIRTMVDVARLPERVRRLIPGHPRPYEEVVAGGALTPVRAGVAELALREVLIDGIPVPGSAVTRMLGTLTGHESDGRITISLPATMSGFRVRPEGVAVYRIGSAP
jgi:hypothetical protein